MTGSIESQFRQIVEAGYNGIETPMPHKKYESKFRKLIKEYNLELILQVFTGDENNIKPYPDKAEDHISSFKSQIQRAQTFNPILINSQSAKDSMPYDEQLYFFENAIQIEKRFGIPIAHETHRGRAMFTPWNTSRLLEDLPDLFITADFSHWCNVCESILPDHQESLSIAIERTIHIHGRVGYEQGPQVPDFRASEYEYALEQHETWWEEIMANCRANGNSNITFTPEFGPPGYMQAQPYTKQPVVDLWEICLAMNQRVRKRFENI